MGFVTNGSFIDNGFADSFRRTLTEEFSAIYVFNLRGNQRTSGETSRREGGKIFGQGSRTPVAITLLVKKPAASGGCTLRYRDIGDYLSREKKLEIIEQFGSIEAVPWQILKPNESGDWINQRDDLFQRFAPLGDKRDRTVDPVVDLYSLGIITARDAWAYNFSKPAMLANMRRTVDFYTQQSVDFDAWLRKDGHTRTAEAVVDFIDRDPAKISWTHNLKEDLRRGKSGSFDAGVAVTSMYRPFCKQWLYFDRRLNERVYQIPRLFPTRKHENLVIATTGVGASRPFSVLITDTVPNLHLQDTGQVFPLYYYDETGKNADLLSSSDQKGYRRHDAVTDTTLAEYRKRYGDDIDKLDIFYYVYGLLHSTEYKDRFAADLKKMIPRIPMVGDFWGFSRAGRELATWHLNYETIEPWPLEEHVSGQGGPDFGVTKMRFTRVGANIDKSSIVYNRTLTLCGIPLEAYEYEVNGRSAIEWIMDRYQIKIDKASGIVNNPNHWSAEAGDPRYIVDLLRRLVRVSVETIKIVKSLPPLTLPGA